MSLRFFSLLLRNSYQKKILFNVTKTQFSSRDNVNIEYPQNMCIFQLENFARLLKKGKLITPN